MVPVVVNSPLFDDFLRFRHIPEPVLIQALVSVVLYPDR